MDRKQFITLTCGLCGIDAAAALMQGCKKYDAPPVDFTLDLSDPANAALVNVNGYVVSHNVMVMRIASGWKAISTVCTHEGCIVNFNGSDFNCPCHGGKYNGNGQVTSGPPPAALKTYPVIESGNVLTIKG